MDTLDKFERVFKLHRELAGRKNGISFDDLQSNLGWTRSTLRRTINFLRDGPLHAPVVHEPSRGGFRYDGDALYELPGLWFSAEELSALLVLEEATAQQPLGLLSEALAPAGKRLRKLLEQSGVGVPDWRFRVRLLRMAARSVGTQFSIVADAMSRRSRLRIDYHARSDDRMAPRIVSPQRLTLYRDNWYLDAWCHTRNDLRIFALDRVIAAELRDEPAQEVPADQLNQTLTTSYGIFAGEPTATAVLRFSPEAARWIAAETWHPQQQDTTDETGHLVRRLPYHRADELAMDILRHGADVEVLEPAMLRQNVIARLQRALGRYAPSPANNELPDEKSAPPAPAINFRSSL
ncbi:WYL domain-containing protein [Hydrocarboniphaga sp.]|uniref:helix-turn-helix transcriptional regulator n=1 Tax=Hydrocarboniphaga sp. TaxID=2033016 RepID=UPI00262BBCBA|nr:WYL domain-containing protein [Hydrocarboniphaga sp.]